MKLPIEPVGGTSGWLLACAIGLLAGCSAPAKEWLIGEEVETHPGYQEYHRTLDEVFQDVSSQFWPVRDVDQYQRKDVWRIPENGEGDCEDFALWVQQELNARGITGTLIVLGWTETGVYHAVLSTADGLILDNRMPRVVTNADLERRGYSWEYAITEDGNQYRLSSY